MKNTGALRRDYQRQLGAKQDRAYVFPGNLGDQAGIVEVPGQPGIVSVSLLTEVVQCYAEPAIPRVPGLPVMVGYSQEQPALLQVIAVRAGGLELALGGNQLGSHHAQHEWPQADTVFVNTRQMLPLRITIVPPWGVTFWPGHVWIGPALYEIQAPEEEFDLQALVPTTTGKARLIWFTLDSSGVITQIDGSEVDQEDLTPSALPTFPADTWYILGAIRLFYGQTTLSEAISGTDVLDLRFPIFHRHTGDQLVIGLDDLTDVESAAATNQQLLHWVAAEGLWKPFTPTHYEILQDSEGAIMTDSSGIDILYAEMEA